MRIRMCAEVRPVRCQILDELAKIGIAIKIASEKERTFGLMPRQCLSNMLAALGKAVAGFNAFTYVFQMLPPIFESGRDAAPKPATLHSPIFLPARRALASFALPPLQEP